MKIQKCDSRSLYLTPCNYFPIQYLQFVTTQKTFLRSLRDAACKRSANFCCLIGGCGLESRRRSGPGSGNRFSVSLRQSRRQLVWWALSALQATRLSQSLSRPRVLSVSNKKCFRYLASRKIVNNLVRVRRRNWNIWKLFWRKQRNGSVRNRTRPWRNSPGPYRERRQVQSSKDQIRKSIWDKVSSETAQTFSSGKWQVKEQLRTVRNWILGWFIREWRVSWWDEQWRGPAGVLWSLLISQEKPSVPAQFVWE